MENRNKIVLLLTSYNAEGHTATLAKSFIKGVEDAGGSVDYIHVGAMNISGCRGCNGCAKTHSCVVQDGLMPVIEKIRDADTVVFASPVYFGNMNSTMKAVIDRLFCLHGESLAPHRIALLMTGDGGEITRRGGRKNFEPARYSYRSAFGYLDWEDQGIVIAEHIETNEDVVNSTAYKEAYELGKKLA